METRKVQISGGSTFIVSLPKKWAQKMGISSGSSVNILEDKSGYLILSPQPLNFKETITGEIRISGKESPDALMRRLVGAYVSGVNHLMVVSKGAISPLHARKVREFTRLVMGMEIVEEKKDLIKLQDLIDPADLSVRTGLKRMVYITEKMIEDLLRGMKEGDDDSIEDVVMRDIEVDRINWLIHKEYNMIIKSPKIAEKTNISTEDAFNYMLTARIVERVADHAVSMAQYAMEPGETSNREIVNTVMEDGDLAKDIFADSVRSLFSRDLQMADDVIDRSRVLKDRLEPHLKTVFKLPADEAVLLAYMLNSIERIGAYGGDIAKITLNTYIPVKQI
ncbi:MAG: PhoU domain-containing protein [Candidatus Thermoplasmatota archaeon]|nr:PhoU domain-containing protein [Candidatus Thermoplasmatota archaeon]